MYHSILWLMITYTCLITTVIATSGNMFRLPNGDTINCWTHTRRSPPNITNLVDCYNAINMIPSGIGMSLTRYGHPTKPISMLLSHDGGRGLRLPAAFIAGSCAVTVRSMHRDTPHPPEQAATAMLFQVWPRVRAAARNITRACMLPNTPGPLYKHDGRFVSGNMMTRSILDGWSFYYDVQVRGAPDTLPEPANIGDMERIEVHNKYFNSKIPWVDKIRTKRLREENAYLATSEAFVDGSPRSNKSSRRKPNTRYKEAFLA
jgi:hypothetical protein